MGGREVPAVSLKNMFFLKQGVSTKELEQLG